jgi:predicted MFS family arabinose efflux permease
VVTDAQLPRANARLSAAFTVGNQLAGPPLGALLFAVGAAWPFGAEAATFVLAGLLVRSLPAPPLHSATTRTRGWLRRDIAEGVRWLWSNPPVRLLAAVLAVMNVTFAAAFATWVLYAHQRLGLSARGFGVLLTASAVGALAGAAFVGRLTDRFGSAALLRAGLTIETVVHLVLALTRSPWVAGSAMVAFGAHATVWGVVSATVRQRLVPDRLRGRVGSVYYLLVMGGSALGALAGGVLGRDGRQRSPRRRRLALVLGRQRPRERIRRRRAISSISGRHRSDIGTPGVTVVAAAVLAKADRGGHPPLSTS